jgi:hypothetical protein
MGERRITFRVPSVVGARADRLAKKRGYLTVGGRPNVSLLMRALLDEEDARIRAHERTLKEAEAALIAAAGSNTRKKKVRKR